MNWRRMYGYDIRNMKSRKDIAEKVKSMEIDPFDIEEIFIDTLDRERKSREKLLKGLEGGYTASNIKRAVRLFKRILR